MVVNGPGIESASYILSFDTQDSVNKALVGGKGANLGRLAQAGFRVPSGFNITTVAYSDFMNVTGLKHELLSILGKANYDDADDLEVRTKNIRNLIMKTALPSEMSEAITKHYKSLGDDIYVAVRSSGTAEDLAEASFAGMHDTYLDVRQSEVLINAVRACWASLWTSRATTYRYRNGFDHTETQLSVVIQRMVSSEVSGVMFTANPLTTETDEVMINASWGLGEAVVSGIVTPDTIVLKLGDRLHVRDYLLGTKELRICRDQSKACGTITEPTTDSERGKFALSDEQAIDLALLGLRIQEYYAGFPQDIEWGLEDETFYLLQSRPITGVDFSWDADCEDWQVFPEVDHTTWTRSLADENWTGAISPLMYSWRGESWALGQSTNAKLWDIDPLKGNRFWKFHKSTVYFNCDLERKIIENTVPPAFRPALMAHIPTLWHKEVAKAPFNWINYGRLYARVELLRPQFYKGFKDLEEKWYPRFSSEGSGIPREELLHLSDVQLKQYINRLINVEDDYMCEMWTWYVVHARDVLILLGVLLQQWYDPEDRMAFQALLSGTPRRSETMKQNHKLWELSHMIRMSKVLSTCFSQHKDGAFFAACETSEEGQDFLGHYRGFVERYGQRGMPDRDIYFPRRCEDPSIDYLALASMLKTTESIDPEIKEIQNNRIREEFAEKVVTQIQRGWLGLVKAEIFKVVLDWAINFVIARDDERHYLDLCTLAIRWGFMDLGRRLVERGVFDTIDDTWFLTKLELFALLDSGNMKPLMRAKVTARRRDFERMLRREINQSPYLLNGKGVDLDTPAEINDGMIRGIGTAKGTVTARARVIKQLKDIGKVQEGEILVVNSTDPGWTPVFHIITGLVLETGGILAHGSCLAREYGLPSVQIARAMQLIPDGAIICINGDQGSVSIITCDT